MTLSIPVSCPDCTEVLRVPLVALPDQRLSVDPSVLEEHVEEHGEGR
jgi:hypothetical protein